LARPRVTIACHCGARLAVPYGARQACESCGRWWSTLQIPEADYRAVLATRRRFRQNEVSFVLVALGVAAALLLVGRNAPIIISLPAFALAWARYFRPWWRQRKRKALEGLPVWDLQPESGPEG
jgi:hypothetical protein